MKHGGDPTIYPGTWEMKISLMEADLEDIKQTLAGNQSAKRYTLMLIEKEALENAIGIHKAKIAKNRAVALQAEATDELWKHQTGVIKRT